MHKPIAPLAAVAALSLSGPAVAADFLPVLNADYRPDPVIAVLGGTENPDVDGSGSDSVAGLELSLACPLLELEGPGIRQQISVTRYDNDGLELTHVELNPHYLIPLATDLALGVGPGLGYVDASRDNGDDDGVLALQAGVSLHYRTGPLFLGAEYRYQWTEEADLGATNDTELDTQRAVAKFGVSF